MPQLPIYIIYMDNNGHAHAVAQSDAGVLGDVRENAIALVAVQGIDIWSELIDEVGCPQNHRHRSRQGRRRNRGRIG